MSTREAAQWLEEARQSLEEATYALGMAWGALPKKHPRRASVALTHNLTRELERETRTTANVTGAGVRRRRSST